MREMLLSSPMYRRGNRGTEILSNLLKATQLVDGRTWAWTQDIWSRAVSVTLLGSGSGERLPKSSDVSTDEVEEAAKFAGSKE